MKNPTAYIRLGIAFMRENPQLIYTALLLLVIPLVFIFSSQWFLRVANENQERIVREQIGVLQDVIAEFARDRLDDPSQIAGHFSALGAANPSVAAFRIVQIDERGEYVIVASNASDEVGEIDKLNALGYQASALQTDRSLIFETQARDGRHYTAFRALPAADHSLSHVLLTDVSLATIDAIAEHNIRAAYLLLSFLILIVLAILVRQARIIDYAALYRRLEEVDTLKDDFVSMAAHELRSPLAAIRGYAELLHNAHLEGEDKESLDHIETSAKALALLIDDILDVARLQSGSMKFSPARLVLKDAAHTVIEELRPLAEEKRLALAMSLADGAAGAACIEADETRLRQVLVNLIGNAVKYTERGSVTVELAIEDGRVVLSVRDTGMGISAEDQEHLFSKFFRVRRQETARIRGTGLGLWITKELILRMGGTIRVESIKNVGTRFVVAFPKLEGSGAA